MKYITIFVSILLFAAISLSQTDSAAADDETPSPVQDIYIYGGTAFGYLPHEFSEYWKPGISAGAGYGFSFAPGEYGYSSVALIAEFAGFDLKESAFRDGMDITDPGKIVSGGKTNAFAIMLNYKGSLSILHPSIAPYFTIGVGYLSFNSESIMVDNKESLTIEQSSISTISWSFGLGVEIPVTDNFTGFIQAKSFIGAFDRTVQYFPVEAGLRIRL